MTRILIASMALLLMTAVIGCSGKDYEGELRHSLAGNITVDGEDVFEKGTISFLPDATNGKARPAGGEVIDGKFEFSEGMGANGGSYRVQISWHKGTGKFAKDPDSGEEYEVRVEGLPAKYNTKSELQVTIPSEDNRYDFDLKTK
ncbi:MAG: hypothetical protein ABJZ55_04565 [Fuerstiella sp.]